MLRTHSIRHYVPTDSNYSLPIIEGFEVYGIDFKSRGRRMDEMIEVMRKLWRGGYVEHHGDCFDFPPLQLSPSPDREIPIYIGGDSRVALKRAARIGQGWIGAHNHIDDVPAQLELLNALRAEYGRDNEPFETVIPIQQFDQIDKIQRLYEQGMTSSVFGFADYQQPLVEKLKSMDLYAKKSGLSL